MLNRRVSSAALAGVLCAGLVVSGALGAAADPNEDGLWYLSATGVDEAQASGATGKGITVAVIDGPINPQMSELVGTDLVVRQDSFCDFDEDGVADPAVVTDGRAVHASNMAAYIIGTGTSSTGVPGVQGVAPGATVRHYASLSGESGNQKGCRLDGKIADLAAFEQALDDGADIISMSFAGSQWGHEGDEAVARAIREGVILVGAGTHDGSDVLQYPAAFNGVIAVESATSTGERSAKDVAAPELGVIAPGEGILVDGFDEASGAWNAYRVESGSSSIATAWTAGVLALAWSAHPEATGNQMIQALVRTTAQNSGELRRADDYWGYGLVNVRNLMTVDPTGYPDVNPLIRDGGGEIPNLDQIENPPTPDSTASATASAAPTARPTPEGGEHDSGLPVAVLGGGVAAVVLVALGIGIALKRRR